MNKPYEITSERARRAFITAAILGTLLWSSIVLLCWWLFWKFLP